MNKYLIWVTFVAINGGVLFGLNLAGIAGAGAGIYEHFALSDSALGFVFSVIMIGCLFGALLGGPLAEKFGLKRIFILIAIVFLFSSLGCATAQSYLSLVVSRFFSGVAVGMVSVTVAMYISEIAPPDKRGLLVSMNQFAIVIGILFAYIIDYLLLEFTDSWRLMLGVPSLFSLLYLVLLFMHFPESPRWLISNNRKTEGVAVLTKLVGMEQAKKVTNDIENSLQKQKGTEQAALSEIFSGKMGRIVLLGSLLAAFQQITGLNAIISYTPEIFKLSGVGGNEALLQSVFVGIVNFLATIIALRLVDTKGRKVLLLWGAVGMTCSLAYLTAAFALKLNPVSILVALLCFIASFAASFAPLMWVVTSEIFPNRIRAKALSVANAVSWTCAFLVVHYSPAILNTWGGGVLFGIFATTSFLAFLFVWKYIPETKGKTLEQIERELGL